jgi:uncharacterized protein (TIGR03000 family)
MSYQTIALGCAAAGVLAGSALAQAPPAPLQGGTYNAPAGAGAYAVPSPFSSPVPGPGFGTFGSMAPYNSSPWADSFLRSSREASNRDILNATGWNWAAYSQMRGQERKPTKPDRDNDERAIIHVTVPTPETELWVNGQPTKQRGLRRVFMSPPLEPGNYRYVFRASWAVEQTRESAAKAVVFQPGFHLNVDFAAAR